MAPVEAAAPQPRGVRRNRSPDLIVLYAKGTRGSSESALGGLSKEIIVNNTGKWSGDHCMDPDAVPGILLGEPAAQEACAHARSNCPGRS